MPIVYCIKNNITNKIYIGYTIKSLESRWKQHLNRAFKNKNNNKFYNAIKKYGIDCWDRIILCECINKQDAKIKEIELIKEYNSYNDGYNSTCGGDGNNNIKMSEESNLKRSMALKGIPKNYNRMHGKKHKKETIEKMKKPKLDKTNYRTEKFKQRMREKQLKASKKRRSITKEQYLQIKNLILENYTKKEISIILSIKYDLVKKWSLKDW
jgi:group I intron endonuclease